MVFHYVQSDAVATVRLMRAHRHIYYKYKSDMAMWARLESLLPNQHMYQSYRSVNKHMGVARRVRSWACYCDSRCSKCGANLYGLCTGTFALSVKLCYVCKSKFLISEEECKLLGLLPLPKGLRFCWIPQGPRHQNVRNYLRREVLRLFNYA